jgi:hypothetical protein
LLTPRPGDQLESQCSQDRLRRCRANALQISVLATFRKWKDEAMDLNGFVHEQNLRILSEQLSYAIDDAQRRQILRLLSEERARSPESRGQKQAA